MPGVGWGLRSGLWLGRPWGQPCLKHRARLQGWGAPRGAAAGPASAHLGVRRLHGQEAGAQQVRDLLAATGRSWGVVVPDSSPDTVGQAGEGSPTSRWREARQAVGCGAGGALAPWSTSIPLRTQHRPTCLRVGKQRQSSWEPTQEGGCMGSETQSQSGPSDQDPMPGTPSGQLGQGGGLQDHPAKGPRPRWLRKSQ